MSDTTALIPVETIDGESITVLPAFGADQIAVAFREWQKLGAALDATLPETKIAIGDKEYHTKPFWRGAGVAYNASVEFAEEQRVVYAHLDDGTDDYGYLVLYRATARNGRTVTGDGACFASEKQSERGRIFATEHNVRAHAHTRAFNRAVSNLIGFGEVSAEEVQRGEGETPRRASQRTAALISEPQRKRLWAIATKGGWGNDDVKSLLRSRGFDRSEDITREAYDDVCKTLEAGHPARGEA